ncbi:MAG: hypothetical protein Q4F11_02830 [Eubacteriales bacterium]|nr:hypothetical protein [Eubacteriales bacterium]
MIDEKEIMPYNFFEYGGVYSGGHEGMRYMIKRAGQKPDFIFQALVWRGPYASAAAAPEDITAAEFEFSKQGRINAINWLKEQYGLRRDYWKEAPSILDVKPVIHE